MSIIYPFKSSTLAKQSVIETQPEVYPFRTTSTPEPATTKPVLIEDKSDLLELITTVAVLLAIGAGFMIALELMYPGWSVMTMEVING